MPLYLTYLHFYIALSYEATGRPIHSLSTARLQAFEQAKSSYDAAMSTLPQRERFLHAVKDDDSSGIQEISSFDVEAKIPYTASFDLSSRLTSRSSSLESDDYTDDGTNSRPSPLWVPEAENLNTKLTTPNQREHHQYPPTPPSTPPPQSCTVRAGLSSPKSTPSLEYIETWLQYRNIERYNAHLEDFAGMLARHMESINSLIATTKEAQSARYNARRLTSHGDDEEARAMDLRDRILKLKSTGWKRKRFDAEKYERLCEVALAEL